AAGLDGIMLALSSEGGAAGDRLFPLLVDEEDWRAVTDRLNELPATLSDFDMGRLAALLADISRLALSGEGAEHSSGVRELAVIGLEATRQHWNERGEPLGIYELRGFYGASANLLPPVPGPDLTASWEASLDSVGSSISSDIKDLVDAADSWFDLAGLM